MPIYRVVAAVNIAPGHYDGYTEGDQLAFVTAQTDALTPIVFTLVAATVPAVLEAMWVLGNRARDDVQGRRWPADVRSLSSGDVLVVYSPGHLQVSEPVETYAVAPLGFDPIPAPAPRAWLRLAGTEATSRPGTGSQHVLVTPPAQPSPESL